MPLDIVTVPKHSDDKLKFKSIPLAGEISEHDFGGSKNVNWYYQTFSADDRNSHDPEFRRMKQALAQWISNPANRDGPYYIMEGREYRPQSVMEEIQVILLNPRDMEPFQAAWSEHFKFDPDAVRKNLAMDISRIEKGFIPEDARLREVYEIYKSEDTAGLEEHAKIERLIAAYAKVFPPRPQHLLTEIYDPASLSL